MHISCSIYLFLLILINLNELFVNFDISINKKKKIHPNIDLKPKPTKLYKSSHLHYVLKFNLN